MFQTTERRLAMQPQGTKVDFTGQHIFVGLDIGKRAWKTTILTPELEHKTFTQPPRVDVLVNYVRRTFPGARVHCVYEAGFSGFWIHDALRQQGIDCMVVNPADVPTTNKEHVRKTDRVDARKLARHLRNGELSPIYVPSCSALEARSLVRMRWAFVKKQTRCKNQIKAMLDFYGIALPEDIAAKHWSRRFLQWIEQLTVFKPTGQYALRALLDELYHLRVTIAQLTKQIRLLAQKEPYQRLATYLLSIPGISVLAAMTLLTELIDLNRFTGLDRLASYCGLAPGEHSSGDVELITGLTPRRNALLRAILVECAWVAARRDPVLLATFSRLSKRMRKQKAIIRIARRLLNRVRYVLKHQCPYQMQQA
jgi:transposase